MLSKSLLKFIRSLRLAKFRNQEKLFTIEGDKLIKEALSPVSNPNLKIHSIYALGEWVETNQSLIQPYTDVIKKVTSKELGQISNMKTPNQVFAIVHYDKSKSDLTRLFNELIIVLDDIQDPGNMGTIFRMADWFGIKNIILSDGCADPYNPKVVQATMGSIFRIGFSRMDLVDWIGNLPKGTPVYGAILNGENLYKQKLTQHGVLLMGNESKGINYDLENFITHPLTIPKLGQSESGPESLNVSMALGIILGEFTRQSF